jgi:hypothetical protein
LRLAPAAFLSATSIQRDANIDPQICFRFGIKCSNPDA